MPLGRRNASEPRRLATAIVCLIAAGLGGPCHDPLRGSPGARGYPGSAAAPAATRAPVRRASPPLYETAILPLFRGRCLGCHGASQTHAGLDLRTWGDLLQGGHSGPSVVPGSPEKSLLYQQLASGKMPLGGKRLGSGELTRVASWIRSGARGSTGAGGHWAFRPPQRPPVPPVRAAARVRTPIDAFLLAALERRGLSFSPEADRRILIRRVTFDLVGLPPTPEEVQAFLEDSQPAAYERLVDRLLADPRYGERWARHWLDVAGYADSEGVLQEDRIRANAWRYRDYVIRSFNQDLPYDRFLLEQIAGDLIVDYRSLTEFTPETIDTLAATGFLRTAVDATRGDFNPHQYGEYQYRMLHDTQTILASTTLGLTIQCARCHDHKYEPLSQKDYYRLQAIFMGAVRPRGTLLPSAGRQIVAATAAEQQRAREANAAVDAAVARLAEEQARLLREFRLRALEADLEKVPEADRRALLEAAGLEEGKRTAEQKALLARYRELAQRGEEALADRFRDFKRRQSEIGERRETEEERRVALPEIRAFYDQDANPPPTPVLIRGDWLRPGETVEPGIPAVLEAAGAPFTIPAPPAGAPTTLRRLAFARWIARPDHPLTARVLVNRVWAHHFGVGLVPTLDNFGRSGAPPTNGSLLDWLAWAFVRTKDDRPLTRHPSSVIRHPSSVIRHPSSVIRRPSPPMGWRLKSLHRLIVTSTAYRQTSTWRHEAAAKDPENRLLWRQRPRRLEAEAVRDAMLAVAERLDPRMFGRPVSTETRPTGEIVVENGEEAGRRSIYLLIRRSQPVTLLNLFDAPVMETNCTRRASSTTVTQALALMNGTFVASQARHFAARLKKELPAGSPKARVERAFEIAFGRPPTATERASSLEFVRTQRERGRDAAPDKSPGNLAWSDLCQTLLSANEFMYVD